MHLQAKADRAVVVRNQRNITGHRRRLLDSQQDLVPRGGGEPVGLPCGAPLTGANNYTLRFAPGQLPPVNAFWSVTMYDAEGYQTANEINRFAIGDRDALQYNADGSLDLYLQHTNPGPDLQSNWLPAPTGTLGVTMRLYAPHRDVVDGRWHPPAVRRV